jgi:hypothetical protein
MNNEVGRDGNTAVDECMHSTGLLLFTAFTGVVEQLWSDCTAHKHQCCLSQTVLLCMLGDAHVVVAG